MRNLSHLDKSSRGVIMTAAAALVLTAGLAAGFIAGVGTDEISISAYHESLSGKLSDDRRIAVPSQFTEDEADRYATCLAGRTYDEITDTAVRVVAGDEPLTAMHDKDFAVFITAAEQCRTDVTSN